MIKTTLLLLCFSLLGEARRLNFAKCGQAGDVGTIRRRTSLFRTIGGRNSRRGAWPWQVLIKKRKGTLTQSLRDSEVPGGGSIINQNWILTAAHIIDHRNADDFILFVGITRRPMEQETMRRSVEAYLVGELIEHPDFSSETYVNDIALIRVGEKLDENLAVTQRGVRGLTFNRFIRPVCLICMETGTSTLKSAEECRDEERLLHSNATAIVTGFGRIAVMGHGKILTNETIKAPATLQQTEVQVAPTSTCRSELERMKYPGLRFVDSMMCCVSPNPARPADACRGDSGGPLVRRVISGAGESHWVQIGIVSFGFGCGQNVPGYYTNLARFVHWIHDHTEPFCVFTDNRETGPFPVFSESRYNVNESVLLVCAKGYELDDKSLLKCQSMLTWEKNPPTCRKISCGHLPRVAHSVESLTPVLLYGESFDFSGCTNGYYMDGPTRVTCRFDGSLSSFPTCKRVQNCLDTFPAIENGRKHVRDRVANFFCNPMYNLVGEHEVHCHDDGTWEHDAPYCKEVKPSYRKVYDNVEYLIFMDPSLKSSYADAKRNCERLNGNVAIIYDERVRKKLEEVLTPIKKKTYKLYIGLKSRASSEFEWDLTGLRTNLDRSSQTSAYRYWHLGTHGSPDDHECAVIKRIRPWSINVFAKRFGWTPIGCWEEHHFICQRDFNPCDSNPCANGGTCSSTHGRARCRCQNGYRGEHCTEEINCSVNDLASSIATRYRLQFVRVGSEITIQCNDGYRLLGSDKVLCGHGGRWNQHREKCQEITCDELQVPEMVFIKNPFPGSFPPSFPGSQAFFYCPEDYALEGYAGAVCSLDGKWSNITAVCRATKCEPPHLPYRSYIKGDIDEFPPGISVALGCLDGRRLVGSPTLRCENGQWSPTTSECIIPYCTIDMFLVGQGVEFNEMSLSEVLDRNFNIGERLTLRCQNRNNDVTHWSLEDVEPVVICQAGGRWSPRYDEFSCEE